MSEEKIERLKLEIALLKEKQKTLRSQFIREREKLVHWFRSEFCLLEEKRRALRIQLQREEEKRRDKPRVDLVEYLKHICPITERDIKRRDPDLLKGKSRAVTWAALKYINTIAEEKRLHWGVLGLANDAGVTSLSIEKRIHEIARVFGFDEKLRKVPPAVRCGCYIP